MKRQFWKHIIAGTLAAAVITSTGAVSLAVEYHNIQTQTEDNSISSGAVSTALGEIELQTDQKAITVVIPDTFRKECKEITISVQNIDGNEADSEEETYVLSSRITTNRTQRDGEDTGDDDKTRIFPESGCYSIPIEMKEYGRYDLSIEGTDYDGDDRGILEWKRINLEESKEQTDDTSGITSDEQANGTVQKLQSATDQKQQDSGAKKIATAVVSAVVIAIIICVVAFMILLKRQRKRGEQRRRDRRNARYEIRIVQEGTEGWFTCYASMVSQNLQPVNENVQLSESTRKILRDTKVNIDSRENLNVFLPSCDRVVLTENQRMVRLNPNEPNGIDLIWIGRRKDS